MGLGVRPARLEDAEAMSAVLIASITHLCAADHGGDADLIAAWTANKTPEGVRAMLARAGSTVLVAELDGRLAGVGACDDKANVTLNYVAPDCRRRGVGTALLAALEAHIQAQGHHGARLASTRTAHGFYVRSGWRDAGPPEDVFGLSGLSMHKPF